MERLRGMDLQRMVERHGPLPPERVVFLLKQACLSLSEAHALGLVHRDIKPANLFVCRLGPEYDFLKVAGLRRRVTAGREPVGARSRTAGMILGTPAFPGARTGLEPGVFDGRADIYALGCVAFWLLTGRPPFEARDADAILMHHAQTDAACRRRSSPRSPSRRHSTRWCSQCLAKDPHAGRPRRSAVGAARRRGR